MEARHRVTEGHTHHTEKGDQLFGVVSSFSQSPGFTDIRADQSQDHIGKREDQHLLYLFGIHRS